MEKKIEKLADEVEQEIKSIFTEVDKICEKNSQKVLNCKKHI